MDNDILYKEIDLIQSCINRMAKNAFSCKGWNLTLVSGMFLLIPENTDKLYICIVMLYVNLCFWWLDSYFLLQEQKYRDKYNWIIEKRLEGNKDFLYNLDIENPYTCLISEEYTHLKTAISKTIFPMYGGITFLIIIFIVINLK